jgi:hypothetical protein
MDQETTSLNDRADRVPRMMLFGGMALFLISQCLVAPISRFWARSPMSWVILPGFGYGTWYEEERTWTTICLVVVALITLGMFLLGPFITNFLKRTILPARIFSGLMFAFTGQMLYSRWRYSQLEFIQPNEVPLSVLAGFWLLITSMILNGVAFLLIRKHAHRTTKDGPVPPGHADRKTEGHAARLMMCDALVLLILSQFFYLGIGYDSLGWYFRHLVGGIAFGWNAVEERGFHFMAVLAMIWPTLMLVILLRGPWMVDRLRRSTTRRILHTLVMLGTIGALVWFAYVVQESKLRMAQILGRGFGAAPYEFPVDAGYCLYVASLLFYLVGLFLIPRQPKLSSARADVGVIS